MKLLNGKKGGTVIMKWYTIKCNAFCNNFLRWVLAMKIFIILFSFYYGISKYVILRKKEKIEETSHVRGTKEQNWWWVKYN